MADEPQDPPPEAPPTVQADRPRGPVGWLAAAIGEALQAAFAIAIGLVVGIFKALLAPVTGQGDEPDDDNAG